MLYKITDEQGHIILADDLVDDDPLLPSGLDSNRYRCCGNGVVSNVAEWIGRRLLAEEFAMRSVGNS